MWQELAIEAATRYGVDRRVMLATVEAETGGSNVIGDGGNALGFGQVWPTWWQSAFDRAAADLNMEVTDLKSSVLGSDRYSMYVAAIVIGSVWSSTSGETDQEHWENFTRRYVGPGIPTADIERRRAIWNRYNNGGLAYTVELPVPLPSQLPAEFATVAGLTVAAIALIMATRK